MKVSRETKLKLNSPGKEIVKNVQWMRTTSYNSFFRKINPNFFLFLREEVEVLTKHLFWLSCDIHSTHWYRSQYYLCVAVLSNYWKVKAINSVSERIW